MLYDVTAWSAGFTFAAWLRNEFELTFTRLGQALCAGLVAAALYAVVARLRAIPMGRLPVGTRHDLEALATTVALTTTIVLAALALLGNRPVPPSAPVIAAGIALPLIVAARYGYRLRHEPGRDRPYDRTDALPVDDGTRGSRLIDAPVTATTRGLLDASVAPPAAEQTLIGAAEALRTATVADSRRLSPTVRPLIAPASAVARRLRDRVATPTAGLPRRRALPVGDPPPAQPERSRRDRAGATGATGATGSPRRSRPGGPGRKDSDPRLPGQGRRPDLTVTPGEREPGSGLAAPAPNLNTYRTAVAELLARVAPHSFAEHRAKVEAVLTERLAEPAIATVLAATPAGIAESTGELLRELDAQHRHTRGAALDLVALVRIYLLSRIDAMWWGHAPAYLTDSDVLTADDLVDLEPLRRRKLLRFRYRRQAQTLVSRVTRAAERRVWTGRAPRTAGLLFTRARTESVTLLNRLSRDFARIAPPATPPLWVTSLTRSIEHQHRLRALGYAAMLPSSHCVGYGMDIEMTWFRRFDAHRALEVVLLEHQGRGAVNVIDEGQVWHVCVSPSAAPELRAGFGTELGGEA